jgi:hypothetical protein
MTTMGQRRFANRLTIDGINADLAADVLGRGVTAAGSGVLPATGTTGSTQTLIPLDAIDEISVRTSNAPAAQAQTPGAQTIIVTRAGAQRFTGDAFADQRPTGLQASDWFTAANGAPRFGDGVPALRGPDVRSRRLFRRLRVHPELGPVHAAGAAQHRGEGVLNPHVHEPSALFRSDPAQALPRSSRQLHADSADGRLLATACCCER